MYAVFEDGSHQYKVSEGEVVKIDFRAGDSGDGAAPGTPVELGRVLLYQNGDDTRIGQPLLEGARILTEVVDHPSIKLYIQHFRRRKNYRRLRGHRQHYTAVRVRHILLAGQEPPVAGPPTAPTQQAPAPETPAAPPPPAPVPAPAQQAPEPEAPAAPPPAPTPETPPTPPTA